MDKRALTSAQNGKLGGRPVLEDTAQAKKIRALIEQHALEEVSETYGTKTVKQSRVLHLLEVLYEIGFERKQVDAIDRYFNRYMGLPKQSTDITSNGQSINFTWTK